MTTTPPEDNEPTDEAPKPVDLTAARIAKMQLVKPPVGKDATLLLMMMMGSDDPTAMVVVKADNGWAVYAAGGRCWIAKTIEELSLLVGTLATEKEGQLR